MANAQDVAEALDQVLKTNVLEIIITFTFAATVLLLLKTVAEAMVGYIQFRLDKNISIGTPLEIYGKKGRVKEATIFTINVETNCGFIRVPTKHWRASKFIVLKDQMVLRNRRSDDRATK